MRTQFNHFVRRVLQIVCLTTLPAAVVAEDLHYIVDFRDGTVLRLSIPDGELPWRRISEIGEVSEEPRRLSEILQLRFVLTPATEQVAQVRQLVARLGADNFHEREEAQAELINRGAKFRKILEQTFPRAVDFEVKWRLREVLDRLPEGEGTWSNDYDQLTVIGSEGEIHGDVGNWSVRVPYRGAEATIDRAGVLAIRNAPLDFDLAAEPPVVHADRIPRDDDSLFPKNVIRVDFDRGPRGEALAAGTDVSQVYVPVGCMFSTSYKDSYVAIEPYNVGGRSGGRCAATHKDLYQGVITIQFCKPGNARLPAGVRYVGFWTSHVAPDGTALQAFDARGRQIAEIKTIKSQRDFLALTTNVPMAYIKVVPDVEIDPDYAIDDLVFDPPKALSEAGDPDRFSLMLTSGERLHCTALEAGQEMVILHNLTVGISQLKVPAAEVAVLVPPRTPVPQVVDEQRCFIRLADGSVLRAREEGGLLKLDRFPELAIDANRIVALWGAETLLEEPSEKDWPKQGALLLRQNEEPKLLGDWRLGANWIESDDLLNSGIESRSYADSPVIWFQKPSKRASGKGLLRTSSGEEIVLGNQEGFMLKSWSIDGVTVRHGTVEWTVGLGDVRSLLLPSRQKP